MSKIGIIIQREYKSRVMKKSFLLLTFLTPLLFAALIFVPIWISTLESNNVKNIVVIDKTSSYREALKNNNKFVFTFSNQPLENYRAQIESEDKKDQPKELAAILYITDDLVKNPNAATIYSEKQVGIDLVDYIKNSLNDYVQNKKLASYNIPNLKEKIEESKTDLQIPTIKWEASGKQKEASAEVALIIGMIAAFLIYTFIMMYGSQVMSGVLQEKTSRIVEVIVSSVKPFELMMGKIIGIALVGLTQFLIWTILTLLISVIAGTFMGINLHPNAAQVAQATSTMNDSGFDIQNIFTLLSSFDFAKILVLFVIYFLFGYLLYASLFAAIGSAVDNETDIQQFSAPITLPIIFALIVAIYGAQNPDSSLSFWCSIIPFTSPVVMIARLPYDVPLWQILVSLIVLILTFIASTWAAGKIYRTGILMYGKKVSWKELWKWVKMK